MLRKVDPGEAEHGSDERRGHAPPRHSNDNGQCQTHTECSRSVSAGETEVTIEFHAFHPQHVAQAFAELARPVHVWEHIVLQQLHNNGANASTEAHHKRRTSIAYEQEHKGQKSRKDAVRQVRDQHEEQVEERGVVCIYRRVQRQLTGGKRGDKRRYCEHRRHHNEKLYRSCALVHSFDRQLYRRGRNYGLAKGPHAVEYLWSMRSIVDSGILLSLVWLVMASTGYGQSGFTQQFGGPLAHDAMGLVSRTGGWNVAVRAYGGTEERHQGAIHRRTSTGLPEQQSTLDLPENCFVQAMAPGPSGGSYICGSVLPPGGEHQALVARLDSDGTLLWQRLLPGTIPQQFLGLTLLADGGVALCGMVSGTQGHDVLVARYSNDGQLQWSTVEPFDLDAEGYAIAANATGIMVTGRQVNFGGTSDALFLYYSLAGVLQMSTSWGGIANEEGRALASTSDGHFVMAGSTHSYGPTDAQGQRRSNLHLIKITATGDTIWTRTQGDILRNRQALALDVAPNGDLLLAGSNSGAGTNLNDGDALVARLSPTGNPIWERSYDIGGNDGLRAIRALSDGFVAAGWSFGSEGRRALLLRRDASGE